MDTFMVRYTELGSLMLFVQSRTPWSRRPVVLSCAMRHERLGSRRGHMV
jgi:hypothetical protein